MPNKYILKTLGKMMQPFIEQNFFKDGKFVKQSVRSRKFDDFFKPLEEKFDTKNRSEILWLLDNERPVCRNCGEKTEYCNYYKGYHELCSDACARKDELTKKRRVHSIKGTMMNEHGVENTMQLDSTKNKASATMVKRYKVKWYVQTKKFKEDSEATSLERWGTKNPQQSDKLKDRIVADNMQKYGRPTVRDFTETRANRIAKVFAMCEELDITCKSTIDTNTVLNSTNFLFEHSCGYSWEQKIDTILPTCRACHRGSKVKQQVKEWIKTLPVKAVFNNRSMLAPLEIDIYLPDKKIGIEVNGLYWHNDDSGRTSVKEKTELALKAGVQLISIWENEWDDPSLRVKLQSLIKTKLGLSKKIFARQTKIDQNVSLNEARDFLNKNHIQGWTSSSRTVGLRDKAGELVMVMSVGQHRWTAGADQEIIRLCSKLDTVVVGGFSKLLKLFSGVRLISYCDRRFGSGDGYRSVGFTLDKITKPNYVWWKYKTFLKRGSTTVKRLPGLLGELYDPTMSENENMRSAGFRKLSDAGNLRFYKVA